MSAEEGRKDISEKITPLFELKAHTVHATKQLQTFSDIKELDLMRVERKYKGEYESTLRKHK